MDGIQSSVTGQDLFHRGFYFIVAGHIADDGEMVRAEFSRDFFDSLLIIGNDDDICAFGGVSFGAIAADAAGTAGEKNNFVFKQTHSWQKINLLRVRPDFSFGRRVRQR